METSLMRRWLLVALILLTVLVSVDPAGAVFCVWETTTGTHICF